MSKWTVRLGRWKKRWKHSSRSQLVRGVDRGLKGVGEVVCIGVTLAIGKFGHGDLIIDGHWRMNAPNITWSLGQASKSSVSSVLEWVNVKAFNIMDS